MNKKMAKVIRLTAIISSYFFIFIASTFLTMTVLIKGEEISTPTLVGKSIQESRQMALKKSLHLQESIGDYGTAYPPHTVVNQIPSPGTSIKENSTIKVFVSAELAIVEVPEVRNLNLRDAEKTLREKKLQRGHISYISTKDVPVETVIAQACDAGTMVHENRGIDLLVSRGADNPSFIMPDLIGLEAAKVVTFFEKKGLRISSIEEKPYYGLRPGIILRQSPDPGFEITSWNKIGIQVSR